MTTNYTLQRDITIQGQKFETVDHFKYVGAIICDEGSRAAQTTAALARLKAIWKDKNIKNKTQNKTYARPGLNNIPLCM